MSPPGSQMPQQLDDGSSTEKIQCVLSNFITYVNIQSLELVQWGPVALGQALPSADQLASGFIHTCFTSVPSASSWSQQLLGSSGCFLGSCFLPGKDMISFIFSWGFCYQALWLICLGQWVSVLCCYPLFMPRHPGCFQKTQRGCGMLKVDLILVHLFLLLFEPRFCVSVTSTVGGGSFRWLWRRLRSDQQPVFTLVGQGPPQAFFKKPSPEQTSFSYLLKIEEIPLCQA